MLSDPVLWVGIVVGGIVSLIASFAANLYTPKLLERFSLRRERWKEEKKNAAFMRYRLVRALHTGKIDTIQYAMAERMAILVRVISAWACIVIIVVLSVGANPERSGVLVVFVLASFIAVLCTIGAFKKADALRVALSQARNFEKYEKRLRSVWGPLPEN